MTHRTGIGHIPALGAVSWGCTCGAAGVLTYAPSTPPWLAARLITGRADRHEAHAARTDLKENPCNPES